MTNVSDWKVITLGEPNVGKNTLVHRITENRYYPQRPIYGTTVNEMIIRRQGNIGLAFFDVSGQDRFRSVSQSYYRNAAIALLVYDTTNRKSFEELPYWLNQIQKYTQNTIIFLVGTKASGHREVPDAEASEFAIRQRLPLFYVDSQTGLGIDELFQAMIGSVQQLACR